MVQPAQWIIRPWRLPIIKCLFVPTQVEHVNGNLHRVSPTTCFSDLPPGSTLQVDFEAELFIVSRTDVLPNWYVVEPGCRRPLIVSSTAGYNRSFVRPFTKPVQWKTGATDTYNPLSPEDRYWYMHVIIFIRVTYTSITLVTGSTRLCRKIIRCHHNRYRGLPSDYADIAYRVTPCAIPSPSQKPPISLRIEGGRRLGCIQGPPIFVGSGQN